MSHLQYINYPGFAEKISKHLNYSQAVRVDNRLELSGQGGWDRETGKFPTEIGPEIDQAFDNVSHALKTAGGKGWEQVYKVRIYLVGLQGDSTVQGGSDMPEHIARNFRKWMPDHCPVYTMLGLSKLGAEGMRIEVEVEAHLGS